MLDEGMTGALEESSFPSLVDALADDPAGRGRLTELLREDHPVYDGRGAAAVVRMRGWVVLALARVGAAEPALLFILEELDTGTDGYLVAAAARALRSCPTPQRVFAPFVTRAIANVRFRNDPVSLENYGAYAVSSGATTPVGELLATLAWLGPQARDVRGEVEALRTQPTALPAKFRADVDRAADAIGRADAIEGAAANPGVGKSHPACCAMPAGLGSLFSWARDSRRGCEPVESTVLEDHDGKLTTFGECFRGHPSIVAFFYTRCDNPLKCSLTVTKLARVRQRLEAHGLADRIHTAAISYDPVFDSPPRLRGYGTNRGMRLGPSHRLLRAPAGIEPLRRHFKLGVNFVESLVNRHRIELYVLDFRGRVAATFERIHWDEDQVVTCAIGVLGEEGNAIGRPVESPTTVPESVGPPSRGGRIAPACAALASVGVAFFPKCPVCWAAYLSVFGVAGVQKIPYSPWLLPALAAVMLVNLASVWVRGRSTGRMSGFYLVGAGAAVILLSRVVPGWSAAAAWGVALTALGSLSSALNARSRRPTPNAAPAAPRRQ
jgi:protein SCO1